MPKVFRYPNVHDQSAPASIFRPLTFLTAFILLQAQVDGQHYYPGGIGNSNMLIWLNANKSSSITYNASNQVSEWQDQSGNGYHFGQSVTGNMPVYSATGGPNSKPALVFNANNDQYLASLANLPSSISFAGGVSSFAMASFNAPLTAQGWQRIYDFGNGPSSDNLIMGRYEASQNIYGEGWKGGTGDEVYSASEPITNGYNTTFDLVQAAGTPGTLTTMQGWVLGIQQSMTGQSGSNTTWVPASITRTNNYIGRSNWAADEYFGGTMEEVLIYNKALSNTQRTLVENYLSQSWGQGAQNSYYTAPAMNSYTTNLVGIGYTSSTDNFLADLSGSTDGLGFSSTSGASGFLNTAGYVMAAHNGQTNSVIANASIPGITSASSLSRWNRSWNIQLTGGNASGQVTLNFNGSDYNGTTPSNTQVYGLLYNATDGSFATGTNKLISTASTTVSGNTVAFLANAANLSQGYYTLVYSASAIVLPVILENFEATRQQATSVLEWNVSTATDPARFDIERSTDGIAYTDIGSVPGVDNGSMTGEYTFIDAQPLPGINYYQLKMTDEQENISWSGIRTVDFSALGRPDISLYPNPVTDPMTISITGLTGTQEVRLFHASGTLVRRQLIAAPGLTTISLKGLAAGPYIVEIVGNSTSTSLKIIKR